MNQFFFVLMVLTALNELNKEKLRQIVSPAEFWGLNQCSSVFILTFVKANLNSILSTGQDFRVRVWKRQKSPSMPLIVSGVDDWVWLSKMTTKHLLLVQTAAHHSVVKMCHLQKTGELILPPPVYNEW